MGKDQEPQNEWIYTLPRRGRYIIYNLMLLQVAVLSIWFVWLQDDGPRFLKHQRQVLEFHWDEIPACSPPEETYAVIERIWPRDDERIQYVVTPRWNAEAQTRIHVVLRQPLDSNQASQWLTELNQAGNEVWTIEEQEELAVTLATRCFLPHMYQRGFVSIVSAITGGLFATLITFPLLWWLFATGLRLLTPRIDLSFDASDSKFIKLIGIAAGIFFALMIVSATTSWLVVRPSSACKGVIKGQEIVATALRLMPEDIACEDAYEYLLDAYPTYSRKTMRPNGKTGRESMNRAPFDLDRPAYDDFYLGPGTVLVQCAPTMEQPMRIRVLRDISWEPECGEDGPVEYFIMPGQGMDGRN